MSRSAPRVPPRPLWAAIALAAALSGGASDVSAAPAVAMKDGFPVTRPDQLYPLSEVRRGQRGVGYTVFSGDAVEPFDVEVLGIMEDMLGPGRSVILARLSGERIEFTGVIAGMSGSPVYIDGRLVGAVAYRFGAFTREPIAGITPIHDMLDTYGPEIDPSDKQPPKARAATAPPLYRGALPVSAFRGPDLPPLPLYEVPRGPQGALPIATPLAVSGLPPQALAAWSESLQGAGFMPVAAGSSTKRRLDLGVFAPRPADQRTVMSNVKDEAGATPALPIAPASAIGAALMRGDIDATAVGTVTYVDKGRVLAFGHPFMGQGRCAFPMVTTAILNTLASEAGSYKMGAPAREVGAVLQDRLTAIGGDLGAVAPMIPVRVLVQRFDEPEASPGLETRVEIVDDPVWLPTLLDNAVAAAGSRRMGYDAGGTIDLWARIYVGDRVLEYRDSLSAPSPLRLPAFVSRDVATNAAILLRHEVGEARITGVDVRLRVSNEVALAQVEAVTPSAPRARPGEVVRLSVRLRPYRGEAFEVPLELKVPEDAEGEVEVYVGGGLELDHKDGMALGPRTPRSVEDLMAILAARRPANALYARVYEAQPGLTADMAYMPGLPPSQQAALSLAVTPGLEHAEARPGPEVKVPTAQVVNGAVSVRVQVIQ
ncbi:MAG: hypothetical protein H6730_06170 [Deltaproteobacteria bacterium]|nr:hypothetical protein [Deltaproteobacteria bacterium]